MMAARRLSSMVTRTHARITVHWPLVVIGMESAWIWNQISIDSLPWTTPISQEWSWKSVKLYSCHGYFAAILG